MEAELTFYPSLIYRSPLYPISEIEFSTIFDDSLYLASVDFWKEYSKYKCGTLNAKEAEKFEIALEKYRVRAKTRCTPYGLFAGVGVAHWGEENKIILSSDLNNSLTKNVRLDMGVLCQLGGVISTNNAVKYNLRYYPNTSLYSIGNSFRYVERKYHENNLYYSIVQIEKSPYLNLLIDRSGKGATIGELLSHIVSKEIHETEVLSFIDELIESQILISELEPTLTGFDYFNSILKKVQAIEVDHPELSTTVNQLLEIQTLLLNLAKSTANFKEASGKIFEKLQHFLPLLKENNLLQVDLFKTAEVSKVNKNIQDEIIAAIHFVNKILPISRSEALQSFKEKFRERFEEAAVPLLMVLDNESGLGYPNKDESGINPLIDTLPVPANNDNENKKWDNYQSALLKILRQSASKKAKVVKLNYSDFDTDHTNWDLPTTFPVVFKVVDSETSRIQIVGVGDSSAANYISRFGSGNSDISKILNDLNEYESEYFQDKILAEVVHLPENRVGNVLIRPAFRKYELCYLAKSGVDEKQVIALNRVFIQLKGDKLILLDGNTGKEIIPKLSNAHNYFHKTLPVYRFLGDLQHQYFEKTHLSFNWGFLEDEPGFLPRVEFGETILSAAKWILDSSQLNELKKPDNDNDRATIFHNLKREIDLPQFFLIKDGDNELLVDSCSDVSLKVFFNEIKKKTSVKLEEFLFDRSSMICDDKGRMFTNEFIGLIFKQGYPARNLLNRNQVVPRVFPRRVFLPGSEWLYFKVYCGVKTAEMLLQSIANSVIANLLVDKVIDRWFFVRYFDPEFHLRIRLHFSLANKIDEVIRTINNLLDEHLKTFLVSKVVIDTYVREVERYGVNTMELCEQIFYSDSDFFINVINNSTNAAKERWRLGIISVDRMLADFGLNIEQKYEMINYLAIRFNYEHRADKTTKVWVDAKYRRLKNEISQLLSHAQDKDLEECFVLRSERNQAVAKKIFDLENQDQLDLPIKHIVESILHMNLTRLFMGRNRTNEFVIYELLSRHYHSWIKRNTVN